MTDDPRPEHVDLRAEIEKQQARLYTIPTEVLVTLCAEIMAEGNEHIGVSTIATRYRALTRPLVLAGHQALREQDGALLITRQLLAAMPWFADVIAHLDRQWRLQLWAGRPWIAFRPLLLVGPPGVGKSRLAATIARLSGCRASVLDLGGTSDNRTLEGTARGYISAQPCFPAVAIYQHRTANPIIVLEEIDKAGGSARNGDPLATLLTMIERGTAKRYFDKCLMADIDLCHVNWILTANSADGLPTPLKSRIDMVAVAGPNATHFDALLMSVLDDICEHWGLCPQDMPRLHPDAQALLRERFAQHRSARQLARETEAALSAVIPLLRRLPQ